MNITELATGAKLITFNRFKDNRGWFSECWSDKWQEETGGSMKTFRCSKTARLCSVVSALICSLILTSTSYASDVRKTWQSGDQFVALEHHDSTASETAISNDHPVELSPGRLAAKLTSIVLQPGDGDKPVQLLTSQSIGILVPEIVQGFRKAASGEDVIFAIVGLH